MSSRIYVLRRPRSGGQGWLLKDRPYSPIICPANPEHRSAWRQPGPLIIDGTESDTTDCLWTPMSDCLLRHAVIEQLEVHGCTGFAIDEVICNNASETYRWSGNPYKQFYPTGWGGIAPEECGIVEIVRTTCCGHLRYSGLRRSELLFDSAQWDGSDVFMIWPLPKFIFVTEKVAKILWAAKVKGLVCQKIEELKFSFSTDFSPGRLSHWMALDRAKNLSGNLDIV